MIIVSACLIGENVRYDGKIKPCKSSEFKKLIEQNDILPFCPEVEGGLPTPRAPSEILKADGRGVIKGEAKIVNSKGEDVTEFFLKGAHKALEAAKKHNIKAAVLKSKSPSCSNKMIYDGTFSKTLNQGVGVTAALLDQNGIKVFDENEIEAFLS